METKRFKVTESFYNFLKNQVLWHLLLPIFLLGKGKQGLFTCVHVYMGIQSLLLWIFLVWMSIPFLKKIDLKHFATLQILRAHTGIGKNSHLEDL